MFHITDSLAPREYSSAICIRSSSTIPAIIVTTAFLLNGRHVINPASANTRPVPLRQPNPRRPPQRRKPMPHLPRTLLRILTSSPPPGMRPHLLPALHNSMVRQRPRERQYMPHGPASPLSVLDGRRGAYGRHVRRIGSRSQTRAYSEERESQSGKTDRGVVQGWRDCRG